jgi:AraC-like DNA-binding protein
MSFVSTAIDIITYSGIVQGIFLAVLLVSGNEKKKRAGIILGILLSLFSLSIINSLFLAHRFSSPLVFREPFITLLCPFLYFYVLEIDRGFRFRITTLGHFAFFALFFVFQAALKCESFRIFTGERERLFSALMLILMLMQFAFYIYRVTRISRVHDRTIADEYSHIDEMSLSWIRSFLLVTSAIFLVILISLFLVVHVNYQPDYHRIVAVICALSIYVLGFRGMRQRAIPAQHNRSNSVATDQTGNHPKEGMTTQPCGEQASPEVVERIRTFMKERKPYLDPEITLSGLACELNLSRNTLSHAINSGFRMNFFTFVNQHRVEEVIAMLDDPEKQDENLLRLAFDAGFNSKATFNHIFKKFTGFTPKEYKLRRKGTNPDV